MLCILWYLNPHSHKGSDQVKRHISKTLSYFNPHSHEGSDIICSDSFKYAIDFNPHSHEGSDCNIAQYFFNMMHNIDIFIKSEHKNLYSSINLCIANHFLYFFECESPSKSLFTYCSHRND